METEETAASRVSDVSQEISSEQHFSSIIISFLAKYSLRQADTRMTQDTQAISF